MTRYARLLAATAIAMLALPPATHAQQSPAGLARPGTARVSDREVLPAPSAVELGGLLGERFGRSEKDRLLKVNEEELLSGFRHRPGAQAWIGEHVGKWLHAASLAYANTGDPALRAKLDRVARELIATQEPSGYLGTYTPDKRFGLYPDADWDVWVHKYDIIGLLAYYQYTGNKPALAAARKVGDLLIATFGPGKKSIVSAGTHMGMASTSVLEPVVLLYRATGDARYLAFARYIVASWDEPNGPRVLSSLLKRQPVNKVANGKAYEMTSNLVGLCELYRVTGDRQYLDAVLNAWDDIVRHRLYITGSGSSGEHWQDDFRLPNGERASICETCVTVTWEQLNIQLLRLTGEARFAEQLERSVYNHLLGAQRPSAEAWCYYTPLEGRKPYSSATTCCLSSGPRGVALLPSFAYGSAADGLFVNLFTESSARIPVGSSNVRVKQHTAYPLSGNVELTIDPGARPRELTVWLRVPEWAPAMTVSVGGTGYPTDGKAGQYVAVRRVWKAGDAVAINIDMPVRVVEGDHENAGKEAILYGPLVLAADEGHNPEAGPIGRVMVEGETPAAVALQPVAGAPDAAVYQTRGLRLAPGATEPLQTPLRLVPFYAAGADGSRMQVWLPRPGSLKPLPGSAFAGGTESQSRPGNVQGSIADGDTATFCVTFDGTKAEEDWYALTAAEPVQVKHVVFTHGKTFHDGGWFDASAGRPRVQVKKTAGGPWEDVATLDTYPRTTATDSAGIQDGQSFEVTFPSIRAVAIRVIGKPACGDNPLQAFSSCAELEVD